jgi:hypothetical protein
MNRNVLDQRQYAITAVIEDVGWITEAEARDIADAIDGDPLGRFDLANHQLHLYWSLFADTMDDASNQGRATLRNAQEATGVCTPRTTVFEVREIDSNDHPAPNQQKA